jgi:cell division septum initiation protein DivIVA
MTLNSEQMSGDRIADQLSEADDAGERDPSHDAGQPMRYLQIVSAALDKTTADRQAAVPVVGDAASAPSYAVARLLEIASSNADALVEAAREEADHLVTQARAHAEQVIWSSLADAKACEETMSARAETQRVELDRLRFETMRELEERRVELDARVSQLVEFESQYRSRLITCLNDQLRVLHGPTIAETLGNAEA